MLEFHIVWYTDTDGVTTGKNYKADNEIAALSSWRTEHPTARFAVMYTPEMVTTAKVQRDNIALTTNNSIH